jgi:hypothetical protein
LAMLIACEYRFLHCKIHEIDTDSICTAA